MPKRRKTWTESIDKLLDSFGIRPRSVPSRGRDGGTLHIYMPQSDGSQIRVGGVWRDGPQLVFEYDPSYVSSPEARPISGFPDLDAQYRSHRLWPFFTVRMPPLDRKDVEPIAAQRDLKFGDELRLLGALGGRAVASPYVFEYGDAAA